MGGGLASFYCAHRIRARAQLPSRSAALRPRPYARTLVAPGRLYHLKRLALVYGFKFKGLGLKFRLQYLKAQWT